MALKGTTIPFDQASEAVQNLARLSVAVRLNAYAQYSNFQVGAAVVADTGIIYTGVNVENASVGLTTCAEQTAICKAVSEGAKAIKTVVVCGEKAEGFTSPCGRCRQIIAELGSDVDVFLVRPDLKEVFVSTIKELLPYSFKLDKQLSIPSKI